MGWSNQTAMRDANGRFLPGRSGNPAGKKQGTRNRATLLREALADGEDAQVARIVIDKALAGVDATLRAMASGEITPDEALTVTRVLDGKVKAQKAWQREKVSRARQKE